MHLWLEIDLDEGVRNDFYGTKMSKEYLWTTGSDESMYP